MPLLPLLLLLLLLPHTRSRALADSAALVDAGDTLVRLAGGGGGGLGLGLSAHRHHRVLSTLNTAADARVEVHDVSAVARALGLASGARGGRHATRRRALKVDVEAGVVVRFRALRQTWDVRLTPHDDLFEQGYEYVAVDADGEVVEREGPLDCVYRAETVDGAMTGAFTLCDGHVAGTLYGRERAISVEPLTGISRRALLGVAASTNDNGENEDDLHVFFDHADLLEKDAAMSVQMPYAERVKRRQKVPKRKPATTSTTTTPISFAKARPPKATFVDSREKIVAVSIFNDNAYYRMFGATTHVRSAAVAAQGAALHALMKTQTTRTGRPAPYFLTLRVQRMITFQEKDAFEQPRAKNGYVNSNALLHKFGEYVGSTGLSCDAAYLLSGSDWNPEDGANGWGFVATLCDVTNKLNVGISIPKSTVASGARTYAHELVR